MKVKLDGRISKETRDAINIAVKKAVFEQHDRLNEDFDAIVLYVLHETEKFGYGRLRRFYERFRECYEDLRQNYMMGNETAYVCRIKLLEETGVDVGEWNREITKRNARNEEEQNSAVRPDPGAEGQASGVVPSKAE